MRIFFSILASFLRAFLTCRRVLYVENIVTCIISSLFTKVHLTPITVMCRLANSGFGHSGTPSPPFPPFPPPLLPSLSPGAPPPKPARGLGERCKLPQWGLGRIPSRRMIWCISEPKGAALVATVFVDFHKNKFKFLYKHDCLAVAIV